MTKVRRLDALVEKRTLELSEEMQRSNMLLKKAIENERNKNNYFINLSHELRTPLNVINNIIDTTKVENGKYKLTIDEYDIVYIVEEKIIKCDK